MVNSGLATLNPDVPAQKRGAVLREALLCAARDVFLEDGFALASMDAVAARAATTKRTLYAHCRSKEELFAEVIGASCDAIVECLPAMADLDPEPQSGLRAYLTEAAQIFEAEGCVPLKRIILAEAARHPQFVQRLAAAYTQVEDRLADYLEAAIAAGRLAPHDARQAARGLCDATVLAGSFRGLLGSRSSSADDIENAAASYLGVYAV